MTALNVHTSHKSRCTVLHVSFVGVLKSKHHTPHLVMDSLLDKSVLLEVDVMSSGSGGSH